MKESTSARHSLSLSPISCSFVGATSEHSPSLKAPGIPSVNLQYDLSGHLSEKPTSLFAQYCLDN